jgi:hypothetical protein
LALFKSAAVIDPFPPWPLLSAFVLACFVLAVTPGPGALYIVTRSVVQGRRCGLVSVAGVALGNLGNALAASVGLAALFALSSLAFSLVRYVGALYLVYLGVYMLLASPAASAFTALTDGAYAFAAGSVAPALRARGVRHMGRRLGGGVSIGLGVCAALAESHAVNLAASHRAPARMRLPA